MPEQELTIAGFLSMSLNSILSRGLLPEPV